MSQTLATRWSVLLAGLAPNTTHDRLASLGALLMGLAGAALPWVVR